MANSISNTNEKVRIIWLDVNANSEDCLLTQQRLFYYFDRVEIFVDETQCQKNIQSNINQSILLIVSGQLSQSMVNFAKDLQHVIGIYIYCCALKKYEELGKSQSKILGVIGQVDELINKIRKYLQQNASQKKFTNKEPSPSALSLTDIISKLQLPVESHHGSETPSTSNSVSSSSKKPCFLDEIEHVELVSLEQAIVSLKSIVVDMEHMVWTVASNCENPLDGLTVDESGSIYLYTMGWTKKETSFGYILDEVLRLQDKERIKPWLSYLKLIFTALSKLPTVCNVFYQGTNKNLIADYSIDNKFVSWNFSTCTSAIKSLENDPNLGINGDRTIISIDSMSGKNITKHSFDSSKEQILLLPGRELQVLSSLDAGNRLYFIQLKEIPTCYSFT